MSPPPPTERFPSSSLPVGVEGDGSGIGMNPLRRISEGGGKRRQSGETEGSGGEEDVDAAVAGLDSGVPVPAVLGGSAPVAAGPGCGAPALACLGRGAAVAAGPGRDAPVLAGRGRGAAVAAGFGGGAPVAAGRGRGAPGGNMAAVQDGSIASRAERKGSPCQHDENSVDHQIKGYSGTNLPEEIWCHIHSLMPMRDSARVACVARVFLLSWRCRPNLDFSEETLGLITENVCGNGEISRDITSRIDHILQNHSGIGVKTLKFEVDPNYTKLLFCHRDLDRWLQNTVKPGIEELNLSLDQRDSMYNFPCSLLSDEIGDSLRYLQLVCCNFHPTSGLGCLRSLTRLELTTVSITENELECVLSNSVALEWLELFHCSGIIHLKIPCLQQISYLGVLGCIGLQALESKAPNVSSVCFQGDLHLRLVLSESSRIRKFEIACSGAALYARTSLPSSMPNLETLTISSGVETVITPGMASRFLHLKFLSIVLGGRTYDFFSLLSFLDASPSLEIFILNVWPVREEGVSVFEDLSDLRKMPKNHNDKLKRVQIINFSSARSLVELACHIVESATSLECLTLDSTIGLPRCSVSKIGICFPISRYELVEANRGVLAAQRYIKPKVPSTVEFNVLEPCSRCHVV